MLRAILFTTALTLSGAGLAKTPPQPPEPQSHPSWKEVGEVGINLLKTGLFDPSSAQIRFVSGFRWGFLKPLIGKRTFGWVACGNLNAKNRMGGYVGEEGFVLFVTEAGSIQVAKKNESVSSCDDLQHTPVNEELLLVAGPREASPTISIADELKKLGDLKAAGLLTDAEFSAQKAKLLAQ